jgi:hypothetical protein
VFANMIEFWTAVAAVAASMSAMAAAVYTWLTFRLVKAQNEPSIIVYVCSNPERQTLIMIRIANIGRDVAFDVTFKSSRPIPSRAYGLTTDSTHLAEFMTDGPLIDGIPVLGPGDTRDITWGQYGGLMNAVGREPIDVAITYKHGRRRKKAHSRLEVASFTATDDWESPLAKSAGFLEEISKSVKSIADEVRQPRSERRLREYRWQRLLESLPDSVNEASPAPSSSEPTERHSDDSTSGRKSGAIDDDETASGSEQTVQTGEIHPSVAVPESNSVENRNEGTSLLQSPDSGQTDTPRSTDDEQRNLPASIHAKKV